MKLWKTVTKAAPSACLSGEKREQIARLARPVGDVNFSPFDERNCVIDCSIALDLTLELPDVAVGWTG